MGQRRHRVSHVDDHRELGLQTLRDRARAGLEAVYPSDDCLGLAQQRLACTRDSRIFFRAIKQLHVQLVLEIRDPLTYEGLSPPELASGGGKAFFPRYGDEYPQVIQGHSVEHVSVLEMDII